MVIKQFIADRDLSWSLNITVYCDGEHRNRKRMYAYSTGEYYTGFTLTLKGYNGINPVSKIRE